MSQLTQFLRLEQVRIAFDAGGLSAVRLVASGGRFYVALDTKAGGVAVLVRYADQTPRYFSDAGTALRLLHDVGFRVASVNMEALALGQQSVA